MVPGRIQRKWQPESPGPGAKLERRRGPVKTRAAAVSSTAGDSKGPLHTLIRTQAGVRYPHASYSGIQGRVGGLNAAGIPHTILRGVEAHVSMPEAQQVGNPIKPAGQIYVKECLHVFARPGFSLGSTQGWGKAKGKQCRWIPLWAMLASSVPTNCFQIFLVLCLMCFWSRRHMYQAITQCAQLSRQLRHGVSSNHHRQARRQNPFRTSKSFKLCAPDVPWTTRHLCTRRKPSNCTFDPSTGGKLADMLRKAPIFFQVYTGPCLAIDCRDALPDMFIPSVRNDLPSIASIDIGHNPHEGAGRGKQTSQRQHLGFLWS